MTIAAAFHPQAHWLILQVFKGHAFRIAEDIAHLGITAYCPKFKVRRPNVFNRSRLIEFMKPMIPGYLFTTEPFDVERINFTPVKTKFMCRDGRFLTASPMEMVRIIEAERKAESEYQIEEMVRAMQANVKKPKARFVKLGELQRTKALAS